MHQVLLTHIPPQGQNYNIPVSLWVLDTHPYHAPVCFVKPTAEMQIKVCMSMMCCILRDDDNIISPKVSKHVDQSGKIYLPYLHEWSHPKSDLLGWHDLTPPLLFNCLLLRVIIPGLVQILIVTFSEQPPVYSKPKQEQSPPPQQQQAAQYPVYPPNVFPGTG